MFRQLASISTRHAKRSGILWQVSLITFSDKSIGKTLFEILNRGETRALIGGGGEYSYIRVLPDEFLFKLTLMTADFKRNSSGRKRIYEYSPPLLKELTHFINDFRPKKE